jgi:hypothetical protein
MHPSAALLRTVRNAALCRDLDRLVVAAGDLAVPAEVGSLRRWWSHVERIVRHDVARMSPADPAEHHRLQRALDRVGIVLATLDGQPPKGAGYPDVDLADTAWELRTLVRRHVGDGLRTAGTPLLLGASRGEVGFELPWLLDGLDDERAATVLASLPRATRAGHRMVHLTWYRWLTATVRTPVEHARRLGARQAAAV